MRELSKFPMHTIVFSLNFLTVERSHIVLPGIEAETLASKPQPLGNTQINRNGLN